jgi:threonine/homoserine/homoserine lactone efflux protein
MLGYLTIGVTYAFAAAVQPGPFQAYLISLTLVNGWRRTLPAVLAPLLSDFPHRLPDSTRPDVGSGSISSGQGRRR